MRKLVSKEEERKKERKKQTLVGVILIGVLVASVFGIFVNSFGKDNASEGVINYKGFSFQYNQGLWYTQINNQEFAFLHNPEEIKNIITNSSDISIQGNIKSINNYKDKPLYVYSENYNAQAEIYRNLYNSALRTQEACPNQEIKKEYLETNKTDCSEDWPIKNCEENFIIINQINENSTINEKIIQKHNCLIITSKENKIDKITDKL